MRLLCAFIGIKACFQSGMRDLSRGRRCGSCRLTASQCAHVTIPEFHESRRIHVTKYTPVCRDIAKFFNRVHLIHVLTEKLLAARTFSGSQAGANTP